jgi:hypothetical protein
MSTTHKILYTLLYCVGLLALSLLLLHCDISPTGQTILPPSSDMHATHSDMRNLNYPDLACDVDMLPAGEHCCPCNPSANEVCAHIEFRIDGGVVDRFECVRQ